MRVQKDDKVIEVTKKAYSVVYAPLGFKPAEKGDKDGSKRSKKASANKNE
ncbi:hypothetical protein ACH0BF_20415 [Pseudobacillus sp. 179-B 2D1 NHS]